MPESAVLVEIERGGVRESLHRGAWVVVERGRVAQSRGDFGRPVFYRSSMKPLQALPLVLSGAADALGLTPAEIALACGSHSGAEEHVAGARSILRKAGLDESLLRCGGHWSIDPEVAVRQHARGDRPTAVLSNCSGKHAGMLAASRHAGYPTATYLDPDHPLQREIRALVAEFGGIHESSIAVAVDGCGAPTYAVPLDAMARSFARLGDPSDLPPATAAGARRLTTAMREHPEMVAGAGRFDTDLLRAAKGRVVAKGGAEGVHAVAVPERSLGLAVKVDDGSDRGYRIVVIELLRRWGILSETEAASLLERHASPVLRNWAGAPVGRMRPVFDGP
jgi:L-asparaginase II